MPVFCLPCDITAGKEAVHPLFRGFGTVGCRSYDCRPSTKCKILRLEAFRFAGESFAQGKHSGQMISKITAKLNQFTFALGSLSNHEPVPDSNCRGLVLAPGDSTCYKVLAIFLGYSRSLATVTPHSGHYQPERRTYMTILWWIIVGLIAGWATGKIMKGEGYGTLMDIVIGIAGAILGGFIMRTLGFKGEGGMIYTIIIAILGAVILTSIVRFFSKKSA